MRIESLQFAGGAGHELAADLHIPDGNSRGGVVLSHCFACSKDVHTMTRLSKGLAGDGWTVLRFDFTGLGSSAGHAAEQTLTRNVEDVVRAAATLRSRVTGPLCLFGHSLGGAATLLAAHRIEGASSVAVLATPSDPVHLRELFSAVADEVESEGVVEVSIAGRAFPLSAGLLADLERHEQQRRVAGLELPLLILHPVDDAVVPVAHGEELFAAAAQPKAFVPLLRTDHLLSDRTTAVRVAALVSEWFAATC